MFIGMGAGKDEDINSNPRNINRQPWVGRAGKYLRSIVKYLWEESPAKFNIALTNTVRCHPKDDKGKDRAPTPTEEIICHAILSRDIESVRPLVLVPCGASATNSIVRDVSELTMGKLHGVILRSLFEISAIPTYHASFLTRQYGTFKPDEKNTFDNKVIADIIKALKLARSIEQWQCIGNHSQME